MSVASRVFGALALPWLGALGACGMLDTQRVIEKPPVTLVSATGETVTVSDDQSGNPVEMRTDQKLIVRLRFAGTTRTDWVLVDVMPGVLRESGATHYEQDGVAAKYGEVAGTQVWHFQAQKAGQTELRFELRVPRSREPPLATASYAVTVH